MAQAKDIAILGAAGLTGRELLRLLAGHPALRPVHLTSDRHVGQPLAAVFPELEGSFDLTFSSHQDAIPEGIPVFLAVPNQTSLELVPALVSEGRQVVDLSGSFRLHDRARWEQSYGLQHTAFELVERAVFGLPELFRDRIRTASLVSNPGCYATGAILPIALLGDLRTEISSIVVDAKSGVSGAGGRTEDAGFAFGSVYENFRAYKVLRHQHEPEIQEYSETGLNGGLGFRIVFTPHLLPIFRGILSTIVIHWKSRPDPERVLSQFKQATASEPFLRFRETPEDITLSRVQLTNFVDFAVRTEDNVSVIVSAVDNLVKGAAGQAIQNMNLMAGLDETLGLRSAAARLPVG